MSVFTTKKLKEARKEAHFTQDEVANLLKMSVRKLKSIEAGEHPVSVDDILDFAKLYKVDVRELILEDYTNLSEEQILCNRYGSFLKMFDQLSDRDKEDVVWVIKQRINGNI